MSEDLLNFDEIPAKPPQCQENAPFSDSLIDLTGPIKSAGEIASENLLKNDRLEIAQSFVNISSSIASSGNEIPSSSLNRSNLKVELPSDPFASGNSEVSPSKIPTLPPPLIPSALNPVSITSTGYSGFPSRSNSEQEQISLVSLAVTGPVNTGTTGLPLPINNTISKGPSSRLHPIPPAILPSHLPLPTRRWTDPTVFCSVPVADELGDTINKCFSHLPVNQRPQRNEISVAQALESSADAYIPLITSNSWYSVASLARNDLIACHPLQVDEIMRLWFLRWTALMKLSKFDIIEKEIENLNAREMKNLYYENFADLFPGKTGTMLSFDILLLISKLPSYKEDHNEAIHRLYCMLYPEHAWDFRPNPQERHRIFMHVVNVLIRMPDIPLAIKVAEDLSDEIPTNVDVAALVGRLHLHIGDIDHAQKYFLRVESLLGIPRAKDGEEFSRLPNNLSRPDLVLSNRAFLLIAKDRFKEAIPYFTDLLTLLPESASAINNLAMCYLYSGDVVQGANFLESFIVTHLTLSGSKKEMIFNLTSMYDLTDSSLAKKRALLKVLAQGCGDDFDPTVMKL